MPPGVLVWIPLEGKPDVVVDFLSDPDAVRFTLWLDGNPELAEILARLIELAEGERAA